MTPPSVFISYAHEDGTFKDALVAHLRALKLRLPGLQIWTDDDIEVGGDFREVIEQALDAASVAILLVSVDSLVSDFIQADEVPRIVERRRSEGMLFMPILVRECPWRQIPWLEGLQLEGAQPISELTEPGAQDRRYSAIAERVLAHLTAGDTQSHDTGAPLADAVPHVPAVVNPLHIDRDEELAAFEGLFDGDSPAHVLLVDGDKSMGKSWFLEKCVATEPPGTRRAWVDFKDLGLGVLDVVAQIALRLGGGARFPLTLQKLEAERSSPGDVPIFGEDLLADQLVTEARTSRQPESTDLVVIDSLEKAATGVRQWVARGLMGSILRDPRFVLVVAGHEISDLRQSNPQGVVHRTLQPLSVSDAAKLAEVIGLDLPIEEIERHHTFTGGNPLQLATGFDNLMRQASKAEGGSM